MHPRALLVLGLALAILAWALLSSGPPAGDGTALEPMLGPVERGLPSAPQGARGALAVVPGEELTHTRASLGRSAAEGTPSVLEPGPFVAGVRVLGPSGAPVPGAAFELPAALGVAAVHTDAMGYARFRGRVASAGEGLATLSAPGLARIQVELAWRPASEAWLGDVQLARAGVVSGFVVDERGAPVPEVDVYVIESSRGGHLDVQPGWIARGAGGVGRSDTSGAFSVPGAEGARVERLLLLSTDAEVDYVAVLDLDGGVLPPTLVPAGEAYLCVRDSPEVARALAVRAADLEFSSTSPKVRVPRGGRLDLSTVDGDD